MADLINQIIHGSFPNSRKKPFKCFTPFVCQLINLPFKAFGHFEASFLG